MPSVPDTVPHVYYSCWTSLPPMEQLLQKFWDIDHIGIHTQRNENLKMEEDLAMQKVLTIKEDGHWTAGLLWKPEAPLIEENNFGRANAIMHSVEKSWIQ